MSDVRAAAQKKGRRAGDAQRFSSRLTQVFPSTRVPGCARDWRVRRLMQMAHGEVAQARKTFTISKSSSSRSNIRSILVGAFVQVWRPSPVDCHSRFPESRIEQLCRRKEVDALSKRQVHKLW